MRLSSRWIPGLGVAFLLAFGCGFPTVFGLPTPRAMLVGGNSERVHFLRLEDRGTESQVQLYTYAWGDSVATPTDIRSNDMFYTYGGVSTRAVSDGVALVTTELETDGPADIRIVNALTGETHSVEDAGVDGVAMLSSDWIFIYQRPGILAFNRSAGTFEEVVVGFNPVGFDGGRLVGIRYDYDPANPPATPYVADYQVVARDFPGGEIEVLIQFVGGPWDDLRIHNGIIYYSFMDFDNSRFRIRRFDVAGRMELPEFSYESTGGYVQLVAGVTDSGCAVVFAVKAAGALSELTLFCPDAAPRVLESWLTPPLGTAANGDQVGVFGERVLWQPPATEGFVVLDLTTGTRQSFAVP